MHHNMSVSSAHRVVPRKQSFTVFEFLEFEIQGTAQKNRRPDKHETERALFPSGLFQLQVILGRIVMHSIRCGVADYCGRCSVVSVCVSVCQLVTTTSCAETHEPIERPLEVWSTRRARETMRVLCVRIRSSNPGVVTLVNTTALYRRSLDGALADV